VSTPVPASADVIPGNLAWGPGDLYLGVFGAVEPLISVINDVPDPLIWTPCGGTNGGATLTLDRKFDRLDVDQITDRAGSRETQRDTMVEFSLAEVTLENLASALNGAAPTVVTGGKTWEPATGSSASQPTYRALLLDAWGPSQKRRRIIVRKVLSIEKIGTKWAKDGQTLIPVTFAAHYVSASVKPFKIFDYV
jgi:hypothetical protein